MSKAKRIAKWTALGLGVVFVGIQFVPVERSNPPVDGDTPAPPEVRAVLRKACYDCHSNETVWPWYSRIAPASWLIAKDVREGRRAMNFSLWNRMRQSRRAELAEHCWEEVAEGAMPPWFYMLPRPNSRLTEADKSALRAWAGSGREEDED